MGIKGDFFIILCQPAAYRCFSFILRCLALLTPPLLHLFRRPFSPIPIVTISAARRLSGDPFLLALLLPLFLFPVTAALPILSPSALLPLGPPGLAAFLRIAFLETGAAVFQIDIIKARS